MNTIAMQLVNGVSANDAERSKREEDPAKDIQALATAQEQTSNDDHEPSQYQDASPNEKPHELLVVRGNRELAIRLLRVAVLAICYFVLEVVVKGVTLAQFIFVAWKKRPHPGMQRLGEVISRYMYALWRYCTFATNDPPWPFNPWPRLDD